APVDATVFQIWQAFAAREQTESMRQAFAYGIARGEAKRELFELVNEQLGEARESYTELKEKPPYVEDDLQSGAAKARAYSEPMLEKLRAAVGIRPLV